ncbi:MAG: hypothetical protein WKF70_03150 [Chitinophagaceae bacterium]
MRKSIFILAVFTIVFTAGCKYNKEEALYPPAPIACDPGQVTFSTTINGIFTTYSCNFCHGSVSPSGNISLATYNSVKTVVANGKLYGSITHAPGFSPMPQGGAKIPACDIVKIKAWIDAGAPNN